MPPQKKEAHKTSQATDIYKKKAEEKQCCAQESFQEVKEKQSPHPPEKNLTEKVAAKISRLVYTCLAETRQFSASTAAAPNILLFSCRCLDSCVGLSCRTMLL